MQPNFPYTIDGITGEKITFLKAYVKDGAEIIEGEVEVRPKAGPPCTPITDRTKVLPSSPAQWLMKFCEKV
jgi:hypothetical protein